MEATIGTLIMSVIVTTVVKEALCARVPCVDNCDSPKRPVCALDVRNGVRFFDNYCLMDAHNLCYNTGYEVQSDPRECLQMYDEEYSRESKVPFKNPSVKQLYDNTVDNLYL